MGTLTIKLSKKAIETDIHKLIMICMEKATDLADTPAGRALRNEGNTAIGGVNCILGEAMAAATFAIWSAETGVDDVIIAAQKAKEWSDERTVEMMENHLPRFVDFMVKAFLDVAQLETKVGVEDVMVAQTH